MKKWLIICTVCGNKIIKTVELSLLLSTLGLFCEKLINHTNKVPISLAFI